MKSNQVTRMSIPIPSASAADNNTNQTCNGGEELCDYPPPLQSEKLREGVVHPILLTPKANHISDWDGKRWKCRCCDQPKQGKWFYGLMFPQHAYCDECHQTEAEGLRSIAAGFEEYEEKWLNNVDDADAASIGFEEYEEKWLNNVDDADAASIAAEEPEEHKQPIQPR